MTMKRLNGVAKPNSSRRLKPVDKKKADRAKKKIIFKKNKTKLE